MTDLKEHKRIITGGYWKGVLTAGIVLGIVIIILVVQNSRLVERLAEKILCL